MSTSARQLISQHQFYVHLWSPPLLGWALLVPFIGYFGLLSSLMDRQEALALKPWTSEPPPFHGETSSQCYASTGPNTASGHIVWSPRPHLFFHTQCCPVLVTAWCLRQQMSWSRPVVGISDFLSLHGLVLGSHLWLQLLLPSCILSALRPYWLL